MKQLVPHAWVGVDVGKGHHWVCLIDEAGTTVWSSMVVNDEAAILEAIGGVLQRADQVVWAVDVTGTMSGLLIALLGLKHAQALIALSRCRVDVLWALLRDNRVFELDLPVARTADKLIENPPLAYSWRWLGEIAGAAWMVGRSDWPVWPTLPLWSLVVARWAGAAEGGWGRWHDGVLGERGPGLSTAR